MQLIFLYIKSLYNAWANFVIILMYVEYANVLIPDPVLPSRLSINRSMITNEQIDSYNKAALEIL